MLIDDTEPTLLEVRNWIQPGPSTWLLRFDWSKNPLSMNGSRGNFRGKAAITKRVRIRAEYVAGELAEIPPLGRIEAQLTHYVDIARTRDTDNYGLLEKPLFDGLVRAGVVEDDSPEFMTKPRAHIVHVRDSEGLVRGACFVLRVCQLDDDGCDS
ncbi:hypothetical protein ACF044_10645 [Microbacterium sp. NPDC016588]